MLGLSGLGFRGFRPGIGLEAGFGDKLVLLEDVKPTASESARSLQSPWRC